MEIVPTKGIKNSKKELQLEIKKTYQDYIFKMNNLENDIKDRNDIINEHKQVLTENNKKLKDQQAFGSKDISKENLEKAKNNRELTEKYKELDAKEPTQGNSIRKGNVLFELRENNKGILTNYVKDFYKEVPGSNLTKQEFKSYVENNEFLKILDTYSKRAESLKDVPFNAYLEGVLRGGMGYGGGRMGNILKAMGVDMAKIVKTVSRDAEGFTEIELAETGSGSFSRETPGGTQGIELIYKLPVLLSSKLFVPSW